MEVVEIGRMKKNYSFESVVVVYPGMAAWRFAYLPKNFAAEIKKNFSASQRGWGSLPVTAKIGKTSWETSIFPDTKSATYLLPLKLAVRNKEKVMDGSKALVSIRIRV